MRKKAPNPDTPLTDEEMHQGVWHKGIDHFSPEIQSAIRRMGRPRTEHPKEKVTVRFDHDILVALRAKGKGWQTQLNAFLRAAVDEHRI